MAVWGAEASFLLRSGCGDKLEVKATGLSAAAQTEATRLPRSGMRGAIFPLLGPDWPALSLKRTSPPLNAQRAERVT